MTNKKQNDYIIKLTDVTLILTSKKSLSFHVDNFGCFFYTYKNKKLSKIIKKKKLLSQKEKEKLEKEKQRLKNELEEREYQKGTFKKNIRALAILLILAIFTGSGLGVWYFNAVLKSTVIYSNYLVSDYLPDVNTTFAKLGINNENDKSNFLEIAQSQNIDPLSTRLNVLDNYLLALYNAENAKTYSAIGKGLVSTIASQTVYSAKTFDGEKYSFESISVGLVKVATKEEMNVGENIVHMSTGSSITSHEDGSMSATWQLDKTLTSQEYKELTGSYVNTINPYIISDSTILNKESATIVKNNDGTYSFTLQLHPIYSVLNYYKQVKRSGGLEADPVFTSIVQTITIDENWNFVSFDTEEKYTAVKFSMGAKCTGNLHTELVFNF